MMSEVIFYFCRNYLTHFRHTFLEHFLQIASLQVQHISVVLLQHFEVEHILRFFVGDSCFFSATSSFWLFGDVPQSTSALRCMYSRRLIFVLHVSDDGWVAFDYTEMGCLRLHGLLQIQLEQA